MANTTNYSWETPDDTDLVKDGAAAIRTLGTAIDTTVFNNASAAIVKTIVDAKGDIIAATAADTVARLAVGANDTVLTADSTTATGLKWAAVAGGGKNYTLLNSGGTTLSGSTTTVSGISGKDSLLILIDGASSTSTASGIGVRFNSDSAANYCWLGNRVTGSSSYNAGGFIGVGGFNNTEITVGIMSNLAASIIRGSVRVDGGNSTGVKTFTALGGGTPSGGSDQYSYSVNGLWDNSATISSVSITQDGGGTFDAGKVYVYTSA